MPVINTNSSANTSLRYVNINTQLQNTLLSELSSGSRVQKASDDASSLAIGTKIKADSTTLAQASVSAANGQSVLSTADGGLSQIANILQRLKALTTQAQSGTNDSNSLANINKEFQDLLTEIDSVSSATRFNGNNLLDGTSQYAVASGGVSFLLGTNATDTINVKIANVTTAAAGLNLAGLSIAGVTLASGLSNAASAGVAVDSAINTLSGVRAQVGADSSRLQFRKNVIDISKENADAAVSTLLDADVASVESQYTSVEVLTESGIAALQKANAIPQELLQLLKSQ